MTEKKEHRLRPIVAVIAIQLCVGVVYIWSIFQTGIASALFEGDNAKAGLSYSLALAMLAIGSIIGGKLTTKFSVRAVVMSGGLMLAFAFFASSFISKNMPYLIWLTYGVIGGVGMGFCYSPAIGCAQKWMPHKKGFITGIIVSSLGISGLIATPIAEKLINMFGGPGIGEFMAFRLIGIVFFIVCPISSMFIVNPSEEFSKKYEIKSTGNQKTVKSYSPSEVLKMPAFYILTLSLMLACMSGLMMIGFAKPIAVAKGLASTAIIGVIVISISNAAGRLFLGIISDKLGRLPIVFVLLAGTMIISLLVNIADGYTIYILIAFIGFFYGGFLSIYPSLTSDMFGPKYFAINYGMVLVGFGMAAIISSYIAGYFKNIAKDDISLMTPAFIIASICSAVSIILVIFLNKLKNKHKSI